MDTLDHIPTDAARDERHGFRVSDDLAGRPVSDAEMDVVEAFLMAAFAAVMAGETFTEAAASVTSDSNTPQTHAGIGLPAKVRRRGQ
jgi:hypothetical protein